MLGVDGDDARAGGLSKLDHELAADHKRLLIGQRQHEALGERRHRWHQPGGTHDRVEHHLAARLGDQPRNALLPREDLPVRPRLGGLRSSGLIHECDPPDAVSAGLLDQGLPRALCAQANHAQFVRRRALDDVERLQSDRTGGAEDD